MNEMRNRTVCPHCHFTNPKDAVFCEQCGQRIRKGDRQSGEDGQSFPNWIVKRVEKILDVTDEFLDAFSKRPGLPNQDSSSKIRKPVISNINDLSGSIPQDKLFENKKISPKNPGELVSIFQILDAIPLANSNYYKVFSTRCENCGKENINNTSLLCSKCQNTLRRYVLRETSSSDVLRESSREKLENISGQVTGILKHNGIFYYANAQYIVLDGFPEPWFCLGKSERLPVGDDEKIITWLNYIGIALKGLHQSGFQIQAIRGNIDWIEPILILKNQQAYLADISGAVPIQENNNQSITEDLRLLAKILYTMVTGSRSDVLKTHLPNGDIPVAYQELIKKAIQGEFNSYDGFLTALQQTRFGHGLARSLRQLVGYGTDVGRMRDHNEDYVSKFSLGLEQIPGTPEVGLYIVADGMGGHQAGEKASESVIKDVVINRIQEKMQQLQSVPKLNRATIRLDEILTPGEILREAILQANQVLLNTRDSTSGRDRGTTITAALIVGDKCAVANVGDSRTYLRRGNKLRQITEDHSLVARLVASKSIKPSEVRSHPQRNQIYRTLGDETNVDVDLFKENLSSGDQLLLCSDGLWEMVLDEQIEAIMNNARTPQSACDRLIREANERGGEDNISVIVIWIE